MCKGYNSKMTPSPALPGILFFLLALRHAHAYKTGAPEEACKHMTPQHGRPVQTSSPPYTIKAKVSRINGGDRIALKLNATLNYFEGFFIQGRMTLEGDPVGTFFTTEHKTVNCLGGLSNAVTHKEEKHMDEITVEWEAPSDFEGDVAFVTTVVKGYDTFWTGLCSEKVSIRKRPSPGAQLVNTKTNEKSADELKLNPTVDATLNADADVNMDKIYGGCGVSKTCFGAPFGCSTKKSCDYLVTMADAGNGQKEFELKGQGGSNRFVAVGLSQDQIMGDDSVVVCSSQNGNTDVYMSWNDGKTNKNIVNDKEGLTVLEKMESDGTLYCKFLRDDVTKTKDVEFDLKNERYYLMVAEGPLAESKALLYHGESRIVSSSLFPPSSETTEKTYTALGWLSGVLKGKN